MKKIFTSILAVAFGAAAFAQQIPNSGFETWTSPNNPDNWATWESAIGAPLGLATKDTSSKVEGAASIKIKTDSIQAGPSKRLIPGFVYFGTAASMILICSSVMRGLSSSATACKPSE